MNRGVLRDWQSFNQVLKKLQKLLEEPLKLKLVKDTLILKTILKQRKRCGSLAQEHFGPEKIEDLPIRLTAEDFSYYSQEIPVCFFRLGVRNEEKGITFGVHHPRFDIDPNSLKIGVEAMVLAAFS